MPSLLAGCFASTTMYISSLSCTLPFLFDRSACAGRALVVVFVRNNSSEVPIGTTSEQIQTQKEKNHRRGNPLGRSSLPICGSPCPVRLAVGVCAHRTLACAHPACASASPYDWLGPLTLRGELLRLLGAIGPVPRKRRQGRSAALCGAARCRSPLPRPALPTPPRPLSRRCRPWCLPSSSSCLAADRLVPAPFLGLFLGLFFPFSLRLATIKVHRQRTLQRHSRAEHLRAQLSKDRFSLPLHRTSYSRRPPLSLAPGSKPRLAKKWQWPPHPAERRPDPFCRPPHQNPALSFREVRPCCPVFVHPCPRFLCPFPLSLCLFAFSSL
jgi:hypothetical protein